MNWFKKKTDTNIDAIWPFSEPPNCAVITTRDVLENKSPVLLVVCDENGEWQFLTGEIIFEADARVVGLQEMVQRDRTLLELANLQPGQAASRTHVGAPWQISSD